MSGRDGVQVMEDLKEVEADRYLAVIVLTALLDRKLPALPGAKDIFPLVRHVMPMHQARKEFVRIVEPAALAVFLASDHSASMTATALAMNGGWIWH
ncbi:hypothetical protein N234_37465 [Ralstonia pickettii DTP0602]|nr:hypothetical protein N234_37465 [Ralstonia pickettii DTP0602]